MLLLPTWALAQTENFTIHGKLESANSKKVYLYIADIITGATGEDSAIIRNGVFSFKGELEAPLKAILFSTPDNNRLDFYIEPGNNRIESKDSLHNGIAKAGKLNEDFIKLREITDVINTERRNFTKKMQAVVISHPEKKTDVEFQKNWDNKIQDFGLQMDDAYNSFIKNNPGNLASIYAIAALGGANPDLNVVQPLFRSLDKNVQNSALGKVYTRKLGKLERVSIGAFAPEFTQADTAGKPVSLKDFKGKYVLIDFWASWCGPCRKENPNLIKAFERYKNNNFTVLGVSLDKANAKEAWLKAIYKDGLPWTQVSDLKGWDNDVSKMYSVDSVPKNFLIDPNGKIVAKDLHGSELNKKLSEILDTK